MPTRSRAEAFISAVMNGDHVAAIADFYHEEASMQENLATARVGRTHLMAHESKALSRLQKMITHPPKSVIVEGDLVAIQWVFDAVDKSGVVRRLEEVALQTWRGDRILIERFFYDSATAWQIVEPSE